MPSRIIYFDLSELNGLSLYKALRKLREIQTNTPQPFKDAMKIVVEEVPHSNGYLDHYETKLLIVAEQADVERITAMQERA